MFNVKKLNRQFRFKLNRKGLKLIFQNIEIQDGSQLLDLCSKFADINRKCLEFKLKSNIQFKFKLNRKKFKTNIP